MSPSLKSDEEPSQHHAEDIESQPSKPLPPNNHADRAAELIGDQHVEVTEEDVTLTSLTLTFNTDNFRTNVSAAKQTNTFSPS